MSMGDNVIGLIRWTGGVPVLPHATEFHVDDLCIMIAPLALDQLDTGVRTQVDQGIRQSW